MAQRRLVISVAVFALLGTVYLANDLGHGYWISFGLSLAVILLMIGFIVFALRYNRRRQ
jgi:uncharacterized protein (DUF486 family)